MQRSWVSDSLRVFEIYFGLPECLNHTTKTYMENAFTSIVEAEGYAVVDGADSIDIRLLVGEEDERLGEFLESRYKFLLRAVIGRPARNVPIEYEYPKGTSLMRKMCVHPDPWHYRLWPHLVKNAMSAEFVVEANEQGYYVPGGSSAVMVREVEELRGVTSEGLWLEVIGPVICTVDKERTRI